MHGRAAFTDPENWAGGFYELSLEVGDFDDERLQRALTALWEAAGITGCFGSRDREPADQAAIPVSVASLEEFGHLQGIVRLPDGGPIVCGCIAIRFEDGPDWLVLYLPLGALARTERRIGGFPFGPEATSASLVWRAPLDGWLAGVAHEVFRRIDFRLGVIGFEIAADVTAAELDGVVPGQRREGYLLPRDGQLGYTPANL